MRWAQCERETERERERERGAGAKRKILLDCQESLQEKWYLYMYDQGTIE